MDLHTKNTSRSTVANTTTPVKINALENKEFLSETGTAMRGEIIDLRSEEATIKLEDGTILKGKVEGDVHLYIGQKAEFEITQNSQGNLNLKIVEDISKDSSQIFVEKALLQAGLVQNEKNKEVVSLLLKANLSIDKKSILNVLKYAYQSPEASIKDIIFLMKNNIPITEEKLQYIQEYHSGEHRIVKELEGVIQEISTIFEQSDQVLHEVRDQLLSLLTLEGQEGETLGKAVSVGSENGVLEESLLSQVEGNQMQPTTKEEGMEANVSLKQFTQDGNKIGSNPLTSSKLNVQEDIRYQPLASFLTPEERVQMKEMLSSCSMNQTIVSKVEDGTMLVEDIVKELQGFSKELKTANASVGFHQVLRSTGFQKIFQRILEESYTIKPSQLKSEDVVERVFEKLEQDMKEIQQMVKEQVTLKEQPLLEGKTEHLKGNLEFMKTLGELYPYIQLPLRFSQKNVHSDLYVFSKPKGQRSSEEGVSLLLHLDMDQLGPLDIYLKLVHQNLNAKFYVEKDEVKQLFETTMVELEEVLKQKGYQMSVEYASRKTEDDVLNRIMDSEIASEGNLMKRYTFDIRA